MEQQATRRRFIEAITQFGIFIRISLGGQVYRTEIGWQCSTHEYIYIYLYVICEGLGPGVAQWLKRCATSRKVKGSITEASDRSTCPGSTQPLKMSTRIFLGVKAAGAYHHHVPRV